MILVVDADVVVTWFIEEPGSADARSLLAGDHALPAPAHALAEVGPVMVRRVRDGRLGPRHPDRALAGLPRILVPLDPASLAGPAAEIAVTASQSFHDALYIAAAVRWNGFLVTSDERMIRGVAGHSWAARIRSLGSELA